MDRREALKKLAVGGAVGVGASVVLDSTNVAYAASAGMIDLSTLPTGSWVSASFNSGTLTLTANDDVRCGDGSPATAIHTWDTASWSPSPGSGTPTASGNTLTATWPGNSGRNATYSVNLSVTWTCGTDVVTRNYSISGSMTNNVANTPTVTEI